MRGGDVPFVHTFEILKCVCIFLCIAGVESGSWCRCGGGGGAGVKGGGWCGCEGWGVVRV